jgi:uncharacterized protein YbjT (DUF2867 family)
MATQTFKLPERPLLVAGATGAIGSAVVRALLERGAPVRVFVRSAEKVAELPEGVERVVGSLEDPAAVERAFRGVHAAFFVSPHDDAEERIAENFVSACEREGVRLVFAGVDADGANRLTRFLQGTIFALMLPHYKPKLRIAQRIRTSRTNPVVLIPGNYYQNDEICREQILAGTYPLPLRLIPRVDTRDVGDAAARALLDPDVPSGGYPLVGESLSGEQTAANWSAALGRAVRYQPDIALTDELLERYYGGRKAIDFQKTYRLLAKFAAKTKSREVRQTAFLLGKPPRSHAEYARDMAVHWLASPAR